MYSPYLIIPLASWFVAHLLKFSINLLRGEFDVGYFYRSGGMPSAHSAAVASLAIVMLVLEGFDSPLFGITAVLAAIVIYDSMGVRRAVGDQAHTLNGLLETVKATVGIRSTKPILGHTPLEVMAGTVLGIIVALTITVNTWFHNLEPFLQFPTVLELKVYIALAIVMFLVPFILYKKNFRTSKVYRKSRRIFFVDFWGFGFLMLFFGIASNQNLYSWGFRLWPIVILVLFIMLQIIMIKLVYLKIHQRYLLEIQLNHVSRIKKKQKGRSRNRKRK